MVYRVAGVYRRRIDELLPYFPDAEVEDAADETTMRLPNTEVRATPAGFYIHWWSENPAFGEGMDEKQRFAIFSKIGTWTSELNDPQMYVDFARKTGRLTMGRYRLFPFAADAELSARVIKDGRDEVLQLRARVEALLREKLAGAA